MAVSSSLPAGGKLVVGLGCTSALVMALGAVAPAHAATIGVGSSDTTLTYFIDSDNNNVGDNLVSVTGPSALAFSNDGVTAGGQFIQPPADGNDHDIVYHFQADPGASITDATVTSSLFVIGNGQNGSITGSYSTDNSSYTEFISESAGEDDGAESNNDAIDLSDTGFSQSNDLFIRYTLNRSDGGNSFFTQLFRSSTGNDPSPGFVVDLNVVPEPASLALLGLGGLAMVGRRRRRA